jgi:hypothetical protein
MLKKMISILDVKQSITELKKMLNIVGEAACRLRARIELNYQTRIDVLGRKFCGLHDTVLPLALVAKTIFQQLRQRYGRSKKKKNDEMTYSLPTLSSYHHPPLL